MKVKDKLPRKDWVWVVYIDTCGCGVEYVGETGITEGQSITEHCKVFKCNYPRRPFLFMGAEAFSKHGLKAGHVFLWDFPEEQKIDFGGRACRGNSNIAYGGGGGFATLVWFTHTYIRAPGILLCLV